MAGKKSKIPEQAAPFIKALNGLIKPGVHRAQLETSPLIDLEIVICRTGGGAPPAVRAQAFVDALDEVIHKSLKGKDVDTGQRLFALGEWAGVSFQKRYDAVAELYGVSKWDYYRKEPLTNYLYQVYLMLYREGERLRHGEIESTGQSSPAAAEELGVNAKPDKRANLVQPGYMLELYEISYNLPEEPGGLLESLERRRIRATRDDVKIWRATSRYWGNNPDRSPDATLFGSGKLSKRFDAPIVAGRDKGQGKANRGRAYVLEIELPEPLCRGELFEFTILDRHAVDFADITRDNWEDKRSRRMLTPTLPIGYFHLRVRFPSSRKPKLVWHFEELPEWLTPGIASDSSQLDIDTSGTVEYQWYNLWPDYSYGIAWEW